MRDRYLLYIDILGFSNLAEGASPRIDDLNNVIASLNVHAHPAFKAIVFSDTILVYNVDHGDSQENRNYFVMFLCEFAQDLQHRLTGRDIFFRAVLVRGGFTHYELNSIPCFFGPALVDAYRSEKAIQAMGLFMHQSIIPDSDIFKTCVYNEKYNFVLLTQSLNQIEDVYNGEFPIPRDLIEETELIFDLTAEILYLKRVRHWMVECSDERVRQKYANTWALFKARYPKSVGHLESTSFAFVSGGAKSG